jgi:hypothetical protein
MTPLAKEIVDTDWSNMYRLLHEHYYPTRLDKSQTFARWAEKNVKIEYFSPAMVVRTGTCASEPRKVMYYALMNDGDNCEIDEGHWLNPLGHLNRDDWERREKDLDHF